MTIENFSQWRDLNKNCQIIQSDLEKELRKEAKTLRDPCLTEMKVKTLAYDLAKKGQKALENQIKAVYQGSRL